MLFALISTLFSIPFEIFYWIKWILAYCTIRFYNASHRKRFDLYQPDAEGQPDKIGFILPQLEIDLESPQSEDHLLEATDEVFFYGVNSKSECLLVRIARGCNQEAEAWIYLKLANGKTYHLTEHGNYQQPYEGKCLSFSCGNLQMHYLSPMRKWRIHYCGSLTENSESKETPERRVFVKFMFLWSASSDVYDEGIRHDLYKLADSVAAADWDNPFKPPIRECINTFNFYCQMGLVRGTVTVDEISDYEMNLFGERMRGLGEKTHLMGANFEHVLGYVPETGFGIHLATCTVPKLFKNLKFGFVMNESGILNNINDLDITMKPFSSVKAQRDFQATFNTDSALYECNGSVSLAPIVLYSGQGWNGCVEVLLVSFTIMNRTGIGLYLSGEIYNEPVKHSKVVAPLPFPNTVPFTVKFSDEISQFGEISGGKGSSLGKLTKLSRSDKTFTVPKGIIVTTSAYESFLTKDTLKAIKNLENVTYGNIKGNIKEACELVSKSILNTTLPTKTSQSIVKDLKEVFGESFKQQKYAVRSSATGEDTDVMSAAGQMDTFLGVEGLQDIFLSTKKCWASQFAHIAVEYKRQNGQPLNTPMAVVVQEMVACEVSGVLFTCDPVNSNPNVITITANYGLGETVVSGSVEPDTFMLERTNNDQLLIKSVDIGSKHQRIVMDESGGTVTEDINEEYKNIACITTETADNLAKLSINVEKFYRSSRDIEWGILNNQVYLLQSRPVTSGGAITDFEVKHEFDSVVRSDRNYSTVANIAEVMPGATSPLGIDLITKYFSAAMIKDAFKKGLIDSAFPGRYFQAGLQTFYNHIMLSVPELICRQGHDTMFSKGFMISIFGRILEEPEIYEIAKEKIPDLPPPTLWSDFKFLMELMLYASQLEKMKRHVNSYGFPFLECETAEKAFEALMKSCSDFDDEMLTHMRVTEASSHWNIIIFLILLRSKKRFDTDVYSDFGRILATSSNIESADIPSSLQNLANQLAFDLGAEKFKAMNTEEAKEWLDTSDTTAGKNYRQFIKRHGHRCLKEFDVLSIPWEQDQSALIKLLQTLVGCAKETSEKKDDDYSKIFSELRVPLNFFNRILLRFAIPNCRKAVQSRESTKSCMIKSMHNWRKGYQHLAKLMVAEGRIPDKELLFFMTMDEIQALLNTRYPKILARANHRRKLFPTLDKYQFPEISRGFPKPINEDDEEYDSVDYATDLTMRGIPVSHGVTKGYARVAISLEEASLLKPGEILIAYSTDIGWSPYFPVISGVVTELGGLISHGAVVSREYGLPCVVGLKGATKNFQTGDYVLLDGKKGILQRLPQPPE